MEKNIGTEAMNKGLKDYFAAWKNKHVAPADFKASMEKASGQKLDEIFALLDKEGALIEE